MYMTVISSNLSPACSRRVKCPALMAPMAFSASVMNSLTGGAVCLLVMATGVYMIRRANRELTKIQGEEDGRVL